MAVRLMEDRPERVHRAGQFSLQRRVRISHGLAACMGNQRMPSWTAAGALADFAGSGPGSIAGISHGRGGGKPWCRARLRLGIGRREESELGAVGAGRLRGSVV